MSEALRPGLTWLVRLRWLAVIGQLIATAVALWVLEAPLSLPWLLSFIGVTALSNVGLMLAGRMGRGPALTEARSRRVIMSLIVFDTVLLTAMLLASGGAMNPFSIFFIVQVALAGLLVGSAGAWAMAVLTSLGFGALFVLAPDDPHALHNHGASQLHLQGMWAAYALAAGFVAMFVSGIARALTRRERELASLRERALATERLAALSAFSASAAHELGTPLSTIAIVSTELAHALDQMATRDTAMTPLADDARVVRAEVERCRMLLRELAERSGTWAGEAPETATVAEIMREVSETLPVGGRERVALSGDLQALIKAPRQSLVRSLANIVRNALEVQSATVEVSVVASSGGIAFAVRDRGPGFSLDVLARFGEPFVTSKPRGEGIGLGLYLALSFARAMGGALRIESNTSGSTVFLELPGVVQVAEAT